MSWELVSIQRIVEELKKQKVMEQQFDAFHLGISWSQFGNAVRSNVDRLLDSRADLTPQQRIVIDDLWANHPNRQKGNINFVLRTLLFVVFLVSLCLYVFIFKAGHQLLQGTPLDDNAKGT